ncbi:hypothetical protein Pint_20140 [Pistacia integerrima]|uniref:Uncharacterized protein n=1 Tax=Pistacia integerrima TaxID=434235 RepID=A0ACC0X837_9ROSI|nr:hypothetical protein Pint_20140 [Pistacia integerrima]
MKRNGVIRPRLDYLRSILIDQNTCPDLFWSNPSGSVGNDLSSSGFVSQEQENTRHVMIHAGGREPKLAARNCSERD